MYGTFNILDKAITCKFRPYLSALVLGQLLLFGCANPFSTREPEPPEQNSSNFINPTSPDIVFINLQIALGERNVESYIRCFVDTAQSQNAFRFIPDQGVAATQPGTFDRWSLEHERLYLQNLFQATPADSLISIAFMVQRYTERATTATVTQNYSLIVNHSQRGNGIPGRASGQATFLLERNENGDWAIFEWQDFKLQSDEFSWSELKAFFQ